MKELLCSRCGAGDWDYSNGYRTCKYCGTLFRLTEEDIIQRESHIELNSDVERLLQKCRLEPRNAKKYANLVLDIDPTNREALKYLK